MMVQVGDTHPPIYMGPAAIAMSSYMENIYHCVTVEDVIQEALPKVKKNKLKRICDHLNVDYKVHISRSVDFESDILAKLRETIKVTSGKDRVLLQYFVSNIHKIISTPYVSEMTDTTYKHVELCARFMAMPHSKKHPDMFQPLLEQCVILDDPTAIYKVMSNMGFSDYVAFFRGIHDDDIILLTSTAVRLGCKPIVDIMACRLAICINTEDSAIFGDKFRIDNQFKSHLTTEYDRITNM
jgi:hypothetical protein